MRLLWAILLCLCTATSACHPECRYACDDPVCSAICKPHCRAPVCQISCENPEHERNCASPHCWNRCAEDQCEADTCPACETVCSPFVHCRSHGAVCSPLCEAPVCSWKCRKPIAGQECPLPRCELQCERPACEYNGTRSGAAILSIPLSVALWSLLWLVVCM